ncbi:ATP-binding cassette domain-containing protein [Mesorhizobium sp. M3A.F.Ca.ET.080.04.2.1]|uniref:ABC transporter ATP-binding protein n=2 Tax=Mesorhizobium TaxID=68287 RepID=UPI000F7587A9|nr:MULTISPECIES: ATP-binding cassette domain-containing protein [unclassified Mesorhizobium]AZO09455.1 ATP-binding cassette domain-containing protein [Mesorhizobium sp. M3A.F.Ca.ET.080.04.2.1]RWB67944.1 MAG: ATP-binding cassette domain-containing protein [Mesorhizobium sp.]RWB87700.1 MAG: ATP-binding cassette domain-containing protein [Mesorhizobium sp.]RWE33414.1 MAG: ATP-binding cassette domain-containing protein [Mesorhizobium sp.]RWF25312.1 MAG: ATP-binding cassette domain-containing prote
MAALMLEIRIEAKAFPTQGGRKRRAIFRDFALDVPEGQVCVLAGPSGVGKSTLLSIVSGIDRGFGGTISGRALPVGMMFQTPRLLPWLTALRNIELAIPGREHEAPRWLAAVGLEDHGEDHPQRLSGGMARRVALARALAVEPALLLLDEPFASLDETTAEAMRLLLGGIFAKRRPTTLLVTHDLAHASALADRVVVLEGSPAGITRDVAIARSHGSAPPRAGQGGSVG